MKRLKALACRLFHWRNHWKLESVNYTGNTRAESYHCTKCNHYWRKTYER